MPRPLDDLRVIDLSSNLAGPYCGQILADMGADVIKVERPGTGDPSRAWAPPAWGGEGTLFLSSNRGKRSLALELGTDRGQEILHGLLGEADVAIQAFRPDVARRFGLTEEALRPRYPSLIFCSVTAFDPDGPLAERPGYDPLLQAHGGLLSVTGPPDGPPARVGTSIIDMGAGMWAAIGILGALRDRDATGRGSHVRISLEDTALAWGAYHLQGTLATGTPPTAMGTGLGMIVPYGAFPTRDGHLMIAAGTDALFRALCEAIGLDALATDPRFATNPKRVEHRKRVETAVTEATRPLTLDALEARLSSAGVPCARVRDFGEVASDPSVLDGIFRREAHPTIPDYRAVAHPVVTDGHRPEPTRPPPAAGEHTEEILREHGFAPNDDSVEPLSRDTPPPRDGLPSRDEPPSPDDP